MKKISFIIFFLLTLGVFNVQAESNAPVIYGAEDKTVEWSTNEPNLLADITATDYDGSDLTDLIQVTDIPNDTGTYVVTYSVTNSLGITAEETINFTIKDTHIPSIFDSAIHDVEVNTELPDWSTFVAVKDDYDTHHDLETTVDYNDDEFDLYHVGTYPVTITATDTNGNVRTRVLQVKVVDTTLPTVVESNELIIEVNDENIDWLDGLEIDDNYDESCHVEVNDYGVDITYPGIYEVIYTIRDSSYNQVIYTRNITVEDSLAPQFQGLVNHLEINIGETFDSLSGITAIDNGDGDVTDSILVSGSVDTNQVGTYTLIYSVSDQFGNLNEETIYVNVVDNIKPILENVSDRTIFVGESFNPLEGITASDNVDGNLSNRVSFLGDYDVSKAGKYQITVKIEDSNGNLTEETYLLTVKEKNNPIFIYIAAFIPIVVVLGIILYKKKSV